MNLKKWFKIGRFGHRARHCEMERALFLTVYRSMSAVE